MLLDRNGETPELWTRTESAAPGNMARPLLTLEALPAALGLLAEGQPLGVEVPNTVSVEALAPHLARLALLAVSFPAFGDGRGFSIARRFRQAGFTGRLRAVGPLIPDQFAYALACGFDEVELPASSAARQNVEQWRQAASWKGDAYQRGYDRESSILDRRRLARGGAR
jgi:uncharacterized protein (DUF934 family)